MKKEFQFVMLKKEYICTMRRENALLNNNTVALQLHVPLTCIHTHTFFVNYLFL